MRNNLWMTFLTIAIVIGTIGFALWFGAGDLPLLLPKGMIAIKERNLLVISSLLMLIVVIPVFVMAFYFALKYRQDNDHDDYKPDWDHSNLAEALWWGVPFGIIIILAIITWYSSHELNPFKPIHNGKKPITVQVVALNWKWMFIYPEEKIATINYVQFPENTPVHFEITADAPMNSFWIPALAGQIYAMPSMRTSLYVIADHKGVFRGRSSNISGKGFAGMTFRAVASSDADYREWVKSVQYHAPTLDLTKYQELKAPSEYDKEQVFRLTETKLFDKILHQHTNPR